MKMTSAYASKMLKGLEEDKAYWLNLEAASSTYVASVDEEPVIPDYDYVTVAATIEDLDRKISVIRHALNLTNASARVLVGDTEMSIDTILIRMAQMNKRKAVLDEMRKRLPKTREENHFGNRGATAPEYRYINYDLNLIKQEYERISKAVMDLQMALDKYNQTVEFEVGI